MTWLDLLRAIGVLAVLFGAAAMMIWVERRLLALLQDRAGPNRRGPLGLLQPVADVVKLLFKEDWTPPFADRLLFVFAPNIVVITVLAAFSTVPFAPGLAVAELDVGLLFVLGMLSLGIYSVTLGGWSSNNKYALVGSLRAAAQMISYELPLGLALVGVVLLTGSFKLSDIVLAQAGYRWFVFLQPVGFVLFLVAGLAEVRRVPFDLPEAESELVAGYHAEYSSMKFALFFLGEYLDVLLISSLVVILYLGGWEGPWLPPVLWFALKTGVLAAGFVVVRGSLPRFRFDQLMALGWKVLIPLSLLNLLVTAAVLLLIGAPAP